jgi:hypothetical protein
VSTHQESVRCNDYQSSMQVAATRHQLEKRAKRQELFDKTNAPTQLPDDRY